MPSEFGELHSAGADGHDSSIMAKKKGMCIGTTGSNFVGLTWNAPPLGSVVGRLHPQLADVRVDAFNHLQANSQIGALSEYSETALHSNDVWCSSSDQSHINNGAAAWRLPDPSQGLML